MRDARMVLWTSDEPVADAVGATAATLGVDVTGVAAADDLGRLWATAEVVLVGEDAAAAAAGLALRRRPGVYLVGFDSAELGRWSAPLGASVVLLPDGLGTLSAVLAEERPGAPVVAVLGGSGGVGASTLASGLALAGVRRGRQVALVDVDPLGGGIDLLLGAEGTPGWRWPRLTGARGEVSDVRRFLPRVEGVTVVSMARSVRGEPVGAQDQPTPEAVQAVVGSLARHHDLVVLDPGRAPLPAARQQVRSASVLLLCGSDVRSVAAAAQTRLILELDDPLLVVRAAAVGRVPAELVGEALGASVAGVLPHDPRLARAAKAGDPPGRSGRGRWARAVDRLVGQLLAPGADDAD